ncbi:MAG: immunity 17 family protein [Desulfobacteraceae bacterium]|nr:immunity 17 family protein [Desulfobacteraceae bacterium]
MDPMGWFFVAAGLFSLCGGVFDWDWYMNARKARFIVSLVGRGGARVFYIAGGWLLAVLGVLMLLGILTIKTR